VREGKKLLGTSVDGPLENNVNIAQLALKNHANHEQNNDMYKDSHFRAKKCSKNIRANAKTFVHNYPQIPKF